MGIFLILFPDEHHQQIQSTNDDNPISKKKSINFNLFSPSFALPSSLKRTKSANLLYKAQSTISICALLLFTVLLLFTISTLPSTNTTTAAAARRNYSQPRRQLNGISSSGRNSSPHALQGMGTLYRRGTRAMNNLVVAHAVESLTLRDFKLFLRLLHRSGATSKSDLLFVFPSKSALFDSAIREENDYFMKLVEHYNNNITQSDNYSSSISSFESTHFVKQSKRTGEPVWGRRNRSNLSEEESAWSRRLSYGSVVGFDVEELDPVNSLSGFLDHIPMRMRRWSCYPMILGRLRRNFKHITLVDMKEVLLLDDPFDKIRGTTMESVLLITQSGIERHGRKNSNKVQKSVIPAIIIGGDRGVRRLSNLMLTGIVRISMQKKRRNWVTESALFNQLVVNPFVLKNVKLIVSNESIPESSATILKSNYGMARRGNSNVDVNSMLMKHICSSPLESMVYSDC